MLSSNPALGIFTALFLAGAALFAVGTWLSRRSTVRTKAAAPVITWTREITGDDERLAWELRIDAIERLALVGQPWCVDLLTQALDQESDPVVRDAAERALIVIGSRPAS